MGAMRWLRRWVQYREETPLWAQVLVVLILILFLGTLALWELHRDKLAANAQQKSLIEHPEHSNH